MTGLIVECRMFYPIYTLERFKVCRRRPSSVVCCLSSVPIKFTCKYICNDYYVLVFTLSRNIVQVLVNDYYAYYESGHN